MTSKTVRSKVNAGWTTERFMNEYGITQEELSKKFLEIFPTKRIRAEVQRDLEQNDKRFERGKKNGSKRKKIQTPINQEIRERLMLGDNFNTETEEGILVQVPKSQIDILEVELQNVQEKLKEVEEERKRAVSNIKDNLLMRKKKIEASIEDIKKELKSKKAELDDVLGQIENKETYVCGLDMIIARREQEMEKLKIKLDDLKKIQVIFLDSGEIEIYPSKESDNLVYSWKDCYDKLLNSRNSKEFEGILDQMTLKEIRQLAKVIAISEVIEARKCKYEFLIESDRVEEAWQAYYKEMCLKKDLKKFLNTGIYHTKM